MGDKLDEEASIKVKAFIDWIEHNGGYLHWALYFAQGGWVWKRVLRSIGFTCSKQMIEWDYLFSAIGT